MRDQVLDGESVAGHRFDGVRELCARVPRGEDHVEFLDQRQLRVDGHVLGVIAGDDDLRIAPGELHRLAEPTAGAVEDDRRFVTARRPKRSAHVLGDWVDRRHRTALHGQLATGGHRVAHDDRTDALGHEPHHHRQPDRAGTLHEHPFEPAEPSALHGVQPDRQRLDQRSEIVTEVIRQPEAFAVTGCHELGEASWRGDTEGPVRAAVCRVARPARSALAASDHRQHGNALTQPSPIAAGTHVDHFARQLVTQHESRFQAVRVGRKVRSANTGMVHRHQELAWAWRRSRHLLDAELVAVQAGCPHDATAGTSGVAHHTTGRRCSPTRRNQPSA
jgi:hypothetical protein